MADVFISYSRKDKAFVQRLDAALQERKREAWVDWEGIRPTEEFMRAIYRAIEGADTFIFILTPDSIASEVCGREIAHAAAHNKRMIPLVAREVEAAAVPEPLARLNWIFCRETDAFEPAVDTLVTALDTDLDWLHAHTRLLGRAIEWEAKGQNNSFVLRGDDLRAAEGWLTAAGSDKERQPTPLQTAYIIASRKAAAWRQRITLAAVSLGLVVAVVLAVVAFFARQEADRQKTAAFETLSQSDFMQGARLVNDLQGPPALAYFARAVRSTGNTAAATRVVSLLTDRVWARPVSAQRLPDAERAFFSPDGSRVIVVLPDGGVTLRDAATSKVLATIDFKGSIQSAQFSPDNRVVMVIGDESAEGKYDSEGAIRPHAQLWNATTGEPLGARGKLGNVGSVAFSANSHLVLIASEALRVWDARTGKLLWQMASPEMHWRQAQFSPDGGRVLAWTESLQTWDAMTGRVLPMTVKNIAGEFPDHSIDHVAFSPDGQWMAISANAANGEGYGGAERVWNLATGQAVAPAMEHNSWVQHLEFNADGRWLLGVGITEGQVWDVGTGKPLGQIRHPSGESLTAATFSPDGQRVVSASDDGSVCVWDAATGAALIETIETAEASAVAFTPDGQAIVTTNGTGTERTVWKILDGVARPLSLPGKTLGQHGFLLLTQVVSGGKGGQLRVWDIRSAKILLEAALPGEVFTAGFSADGRRIFAAADEVVRVWDIASAKELPPLSHQAPVGFTALSLDGEKVLTNAKGVALWEAGSGRRLHDLAAGTEVSGTAFSPDGALVVTTTAESEVRLWKVATGAPQGPPLAHPGSTPQARFSPDGGRLLTSSEGGEKVVLQFWEVAEGRALGEPITMPGEMIDELEFSPDGRRLVVSVNGVRRIFDGTTGQPIGAAMRRRSFVSVPRFSADGARLASCDEFGARLWNSATGLPMTDPIKAPGRGSFTSVEFSAGRQRVVASGPAPPEGLSAVLVVFDATTGRTLIDRREENIGGERTARFSPDDCLLTLHTDPARIWDVAPPTTAPTWLADLAEALGGCRLTETGVIEVLPDRIARIETLRKQLAALPAEDRWAQIGRWLLTEPTARTISPYSAVKVSDYVNRRTPSGSFAAIEEALRTSPGDPLARARAGLLWLEQDAPHAKAHADHESRFATLLAPTQPKVWQTRAKVLTALGRPQEARVANEKAAALTGPAK